jgi:hypothetical protein
VTFANAERPGDTVAQSRQSDTDGVPRDDVQELRNAMRAAEVAMDKDPSRRTRDVGDKASADYYVALHPHESKWRWAGVEEGIPSVEELRQRAAVADRASKGIPKGGRLDPDPDRHDEWSAQLGWFREMQSAVFTEGFLAAVAALKAGDRSGLEYGLRFLEADPWCFRSGYMKSKLITMVARLELDDSIRQRLARVVLAIVDDPRPRREIRRYGTLARAVDSDELQEQLEERAAAAGAQVRFNARQVLDRLGRIADAQRTDVGHGTGHINER